MQVSYMEDYECRYGIYEFEIYGNPISAVK